MLPKFARMYLAVRCGGGSPGGGGGGGGDGVLESDSSESESAWRVRMMRSNTRRRLLPRLGKG